MEGRGRGPHGAIWLLGLFLVVRLLFVGAPLQAQPPTPELEVFVRAGCPHCETAKTFLTELQRQRPSLRIALYDLAEDPAARQRLATLVGERGITSFGVPAFLIGTDLLVGFRSADTTGREIRAALDRRATDAGPAPIADGIQTTWFGRISAQELGLPLFTIAIGLLDGFNPCAMWVLLFLLSILVNLRDRKKMAVIAGTFVAVSGLVYFAFMAAWLNLFLLIGLSRAVQVALGAIALFVGAVNVKDFLALHRGLLFSIPELAKPGLYARIRGILRAEHLAGALTGTILLAGLVI